MGKRITISLIKNSSVMTVTEAAMSFRISTATIRDWIRKGLPIHSKQRPTLIIGRELKEWLAARKRDRQIKCEPHHFVCLSCKRARVPLGGMVDCRIQSAHTIRLEAICPTCEKQMHRFEAVKVMADVQRLFDVNFIEPPTP